MVAFIMPDEDDVAFSSKTFLHLIGRQGLVGTWGWRFATNEQVWSPDLCGLLGLDPRQVTPSYDRLLSLVHPADRALMPTACAIRQGLVPRQVVVRVLRADRTERVLSILMEARVAPDGRPCALSGIVLDVTDRARLNRWRRIDQRQRWGRYADTLTTSYWIGLDGRHDCSEDVPPVHGLPLEVIRATPFMMVVPEERMALHARYWERADRCLFFQGTTHERLASGETCKFRVLTAPIWAADGAYLGRAGLKYPVHRTDLGPATGELLIGLTQAIEGHHIRAARALLDWSMADLSAASGLSLSTVRRIEDGAFPQADRSRYRIVETLRVAGIRFSTTDEGSIAVSRAR